MPLYEYECTDCQQRLELLQRHGDAPPDGCPRCGGRMRKLFSAPAVQFKGSGWYVTDYAGKGRKPAAAADKAESTSDSGGGSEKTEKASSPGAANSGGKTAGSE